MIIGGDFNKKCEQLLLAADKIAEGKTDHKISLETINRELDFDRTGIISYIDFLTDRGYIEIASIGGPLLYGHIRLKKNALPKIKALRVKASRK